MVFQTRYGAQTPEEKILAVLGGSDFEEFERGNFTSWFRGDKDAPTKEEILEEIRQIFRIVIKGD